MEEILKRWILANAKRSHAERIVLIGHTSRPRGALQSWSLCDYHSLQTCVLRLATFASAEILAGFRVLTYTRTIKSDATLHSKHEEIRRERHQLKWICAFSNSVSSVKNAVGINTIFFSIHLHIGSLLLY